MVYGRFHYVLGYSQWSILILYQRFQRYQNANFLIKFVEECIGRPGRGIIPFHQSTKEMMSKAVNVPLSFTLKNLILFTNTGIKPWLLPVLLKLSKKSQIIKSYNRWAEKRLEIYQIIHPPPFFFFWGGGCVSFQ
jgi:hypothetical protein